ncbi:MAG: hypothetical protein MK108_09600 [Mariniblastus sp.]|nr:hypothetical protein [Mariniblastus sp.]
MRTFYFSLILATAALVLSSAGCNPGPAAPALEFDPQRVDDIRTQIDDFEWE